MPQSSEPPDPWHACGNPARCRRPFCAAPASITLVLPEQARTVVREMPGWPASADGLLNLLNSRITRRHLLAVADHDPVGAATHFPILARIRQSGRVPLRLSFAPGEALRLARWAAGPRTDHLVRAWCCTLLAICPTDEYSGDDLTEVAARLVDSCLTLGGDHPREAERLLAWRAVSDDPEQVRWRPSGDRGRPDPVALLALLLLRVATDPADHRLVDLARLVGNDRELPTALLASVSAPVWQDLITRFAGPLLSVRPGLAGLLDTVAS